MPARRRLTKLLLGATLAAGAAAISIGSAGGVAAARATAPAYAFAPYVDMTQYPAPHLTAVKHASGVDQASLGFITAQGASSCVATWGGFASYPASGAGAYQLANVDALKRAGGDAVPSFGGQAGAELASVCPSVSALEHAYAGVIAAYRPSRIDFDIEGAALADAVATTRRSRAIAELRHAATILFVNLMTMDYGDAAAPHPQGRMGTYGIAAARAVRGQLHGLYPRLGAAARMRKLGITPMIGINDVNTEIFTLAEARQLARFAAANHVGMLGMWQLGHDRECGAPTTSAQVNCSGVTQRPYQFARALER